MRCIVIILCCLLAFEIKATGIGPPAGMGTLFLILGIGFIITILIIGFVLFYFYRKANNKKKYLMWLTSISLVLVLGWSLGVSFVSYKLVDNNPLESSEQVLDYNDGYYLKLADGLYKFKSKNHKYGSSVNEEKRLQKGRMIMLDGPNSDGEFVVYSMADSSDYYWYKRNKNNYLLTIPISFKKINQYKKKYEGVITKLELKWKAEESDLVKALTKNKCCDISWIQELLKRDANRNDVINKEKLLLRFYRYTDKSYREKHKFKITSILLEAGADINLLDDRGISFLHSVIRKMPKYQKAKLTEFDKEYLQMLLDYGADPNLSFYSGVSLLNSTIRNRQYEITQMLIHNGADIHKRIQGKESAYKLAKSILKRQSTASIKNQNFTLESVVKLMDSML